MQQRHTSSWSNAIRLRDPGFSGFFRLLDAAVAGGGLWLSCVAVGLEPHELHAVAGACAALLFVLLAEQRGLYRSWRGGGLRQEVVQLVVAWLSMACGIVALSYLATPSAEASREALGLWFAGGLPSLVLARFCVRSAARRIRAGGGNQRRAAIAGAGELGQRVAETIASEPWMGIHLTGFYDDRQQLRNAPEPTPCEIRGTLADLVEAARRGELDIVYLTLPLRAEEKMRDLVRELASTRAAVYLVPDLLAFCLLRSRWFTLGAIPTVSVFDAPLSGLDRLVKRAEDVVLAALILPAIAFPMLAIAAAVKLGSPGPVIFKQRRYGLDGREIVVWKFRSMSVCEDGASFRQARAGDPRVTRLGQFLRATSLDELPQFVNVLQGRMSVVGPRPHPTLLDDQHKDQIDWYLLRNRVKPGITGWAQVNGFRGETDSLDKMRGRIDHDLEYIRNWSLAFDLKIVGLTLFRAWADRNAY